MNLQSYLFFKKIAMFWLYKAFIKSQVCSALFGIKNIQIPVGPIKHNGVLQSLHFASCKMSKVNTKSPKLCHSTVYYFQTLIQQGAAMSSLVVWKLRKNKTFWRYCSSEEMIWCDLNRSKSRQLHSYSIPFVERHTMYGLVITTNIKVYLGRDWFISQVFISPFTKDI